MLPYAGSPSAALTGREGTFCWDTTNQVLYLNDSVTEGTDWDIVVGGGPGPTPSLPFVRLDGTNQALWIPNPAPGDATQDITGHFNLAGAAYQYKINDVHALSMPGTGNLLAGAGAGAVLAAGGARNVLLGTNAGAALTTDDDMVVIGWGAGETIPATENYQSVIIGSYAAQTATAYVTNSNVIGYLAAYAATGYIDTSDVIGSMACQNSDEVGHSVVIGYMAAQDAVDVYNSVVIGREAAEVVTRIEKGVAIGWEAATAWTDGYLNVAIGYQSGAAADGDYNTYIGAESGVGSEGDYNVAVGYRAEAGDGDYNITIGESAGRAAATGNYNILIGDDAGDAITTGSNIIAIGSQSGTALTSGDNNTFLGFESGLTMTTENGGVFLGYKAGYYETVANKLFIDNAQRASEADARVKALVYGVFAAATADQYLTVNGHLVTLHDVSAPQLISTIAIGTTPFVVTSTTLVSNLNADAWDSLHAPVDAAGALTNDGAGGLTWVPCSGGTVGGTGTAGRITQWAVGGADIEDSFLVGPAADILTFVATDPYTITVQGSATIDDWFDQGVKQADSPTFVAPNVERLDVADTTVDVATHYYGIYNRQYKTAGATGAHDFFGFYNRTRMDQVGGTIRYLDGIVNELTFTAGTVDDLDVFYSEIDANGGTVDHDVYGGHIVVNVAAPVTVTDDIFGLYIDVTTASAPGGNTYMLYLDEGVDIDYGIFQDGTAPNTFGGVLTMPQDPVIGGFTLTVPATGTAALLNQSNSFTLINPLVTIAESWIGPSSTAGVYFKGGHVGLGNTNPLHELDVYEQFGSASINVEAGNGYARIYVDKSAATQAAYVHFLTAGGVDWLFGTPASTDWGVGDEFFIGRTGVLPKLVIPPSGNVGFGGITDPDTTVEIYTVGTQLKLSGGAADFATFAVAADGAMTITTVDADAALANIILSPDGAVVVSGATKLHFLDTAIGIYSQADTYMDLFADGGMRFGDSSAGAPTNYTMFSATGHQTMAGSARPWRDELADAVSLKSQGPGVSANVTENTMDFVHTAALSDYIYLNVQLNHDKDLTSTIYPHIHFFAAEEAVVPNFMLQYRWQVSAATKTAGWTDYICNTLKYAAPAAAATNNNIAENTTGIAVPGGAALSDIVQFRVIRDHGNVSGLFAGDDPYTATVAVLAFDVHFMLNSIGSSEEYTK